MAQQYTKQQLANLAHDMAIKYNLPRPDMFVRQIIAESNLKFDLRFLRRKESSAEWRLVWNIYQMHRQNR